MRVAIIALSGLAFAGGAQATQITLGNSTAGTFDFSGVPPASLTVASPVIAGVGTAFFPPDSGDYTFGPMAATAAGPLSGGTYQTSAAQTLSYSATDGDQASGTVTWNLIKDGTAFPNLLGSWSYTSSGDAAFLSAFPGGDALIDLTLVLFPGQTIENLAAGQSQWATISAGEIIPQSSPIPEPATLLLLGIALVVAFAFRKGGKTAPSLNPARG